MATAERLGKTEAARSLAPNVLAVLKQELIRGERPLRKFPVPGPDDI
jgi:hypothetical protein